MIRKILFLAFLLLVSANDTSWAGTVLADSWSNVVAGKCSDQNSAWWSSAEALRITGNVLLYQKDCGGWPKNINMQLVLTEAEKKALLADKPKNTGATIDNSACKYELTYLSKVYKAITNDSIKGKISESFLKGINYYLKAQYANGGWPQFYPYRGGYSNHITYNDNAMINVMEILRHVYQKDTYFSIIAPDSIVAKAKTAFDKGVQCILKTQYLQKGKYTAWCAQHHYSTLLPVMARSYELASLSGAESCNIIKLLMSLQNPSDEIKTAIYSSVYWYDKVRIKGQRLESFVNSEGLTDKRVVADPGAPDMWARFYTLSDNRPFFCDRDGIMKFSLAEIGYERRNGYSWYNTTGNDVMNSYNQWLPKSGTTSLASPLPIVQFKNTDTIPVIAFANKYKGSTIKKFELILNSEVIRSYTTYNIDTLLAGLNPGNYSLVIRAEYNNGQTDTDTSQILVSGLSDITTAKENKLLIYQNASFEGLKIEARGFKIEKVEIFNTQGTKVYHSNMQGNNLLLKNCLLYPGIYIVKVTDTNKKVYVQKTVVK